MSPRVLVLDLGCSYRTLGTVREWWRSKLLHPQDVFFDHGKECLNLYVDRVLNLFDFPTRTPSTSSTSGPTSGLMTGVVAPLDRLCTVAHLTLLRTTGSWLEGSHFCYTTTKWRREANSSFYREHRVEWPSLKALCIGVVPLCNVSVGWYLGEGSQSDEWTPIELYWYTDFYVSTSGT